MAHDPRRVRPWLATAHLAVRTAGLLGVAAAAVGVGIALSEPAALESAAAAAAALREAWEALRPGGPPLSRAAGWLVAIGGAAGLLALGVEGVALLRRTASRRTAAGTASLVSTLAVIVLVVFVNALSMKYHRRFDLTRDQRFTLPAEIAARLRQLRPDEPTTIVVLHKHNIFGSLSAERDAFTRAAEWKVTEKVRDLVELFRELGPRFQVVVLDTEAYGYERQLAELTRAAPELRAAIESAPENSIFFAAGGRVQRLAFNEFLQLDRTASQQAHQGRGNLVLLPQGIEVFARRVLAVHERRPKVAVCVVHELLTTAYADGRGRYFTLAGLKKALTNHGYEVIDIVLKKNWDNATTVSELQAAANTREESVLERLEAELAAAEDELAALRAESRLLQEVEQRLEAIRRLPWEQRQAEYRKLLRGVVITEQNEELVLRSIRRQRERTEQLAAAAAKVRQAAEQKVHQALQDERTVQERRIRNVPEKFARLLDDVDLVIVPRFTVEDPTEAGEPIIPPNLHALSDEQVEVLRQFMAKGRPLLACLGPVLGRNGGVQPDGIDGLERLLAERGIELGRDLVLFDSEVRAYAARRAGEQFGAGSGGPIDIPPLEWVERPDGAAAVSPNPIAAALRLTARTVDQRLELRLRALRPVYLARGADRHLPCAAEFVFTAPTSWNEDRPFPQIRILPDGTAIVSGIPRYEPTPLDDPRRGTRLEKRRGPFPVGVAIESRVPAHWVEPHYQPLEAAATLLLPVNGLPAALATAVAEQIPRPRQRLVVFGSGHLFNGPKLEPAQEKLLLHTVHWLTRRDERLPRAELPPWSYPRVALSGRAFYLWRYATAIGMPLAVVLIGAMVLLRRRVP